MKLTEVTDMRTVRMFLDVPRRLYREDQYWVCPLDEDIENIFDREKNDSFHRGDAKRWVLTDEEDRLIGRIAAFYRTDKAEKYKQPTGGIGFFECTDDKKAAFILFDRAREWLTGQGMEAMDGPVNFGENDMHWGLLVEGYTHPAYGVNYNFPYYRDLFEAYGFSPFFEQVTRHLDIDTPFPDRFWKIAEWVMRKPGFSFRHFRMSEADQYADDMVKVHNAAWVQHEHFSPITREVVKRGLDAARPVLIEEFIWFAYYENEPIGFLVMIPDVNQILKRLNGKLHLWNKIRFLFYKWTRTITRTRITILGVVPKFQGGGVESALFWHLQEPVLVKRPHLKEIEISWVGDFNPKMQSLLEAMNAKPGKKHITYRKLFTGDGETQRAMRIE